MTAEPAETTRTVAVAGKPLPSGTCAVPSHSPASALMRSNSALGGSAESAGAEATTATRHITDLMGRSSARHLPRSNDWDQAARRSAPDLRQRADEVRPQ